MIKEIIEDYIVYNGSLISIPEENTLSQSSFRTIYEVVRIISGIPLFIERHMERLEASARLMNYSITSISDKIQESMMDLIKANNNPDKNVKIIVFNMDNPIPDFMLYFIQSSYPTPEEYKMGVHGILIYEERDNPNAKIINTNFKDRIAAALADAKAYEALLVNKKNKITEGSRSNMFFVRNGTVITAPKGDVLLGITRLSVFELCRKLGIDIIEEPVPETILREMDGVFMTGTSPKILPIRSIDDMSFGSADNPVIKSLMKGYDDIIAEYIERKKG